MKGLCLYFIALMSIASLIACNSSVKKKSAGKDKIAVEDTIGIKLQLITDALGMPVELNAPRDNTHRMFITDNQGKIWIVKNDSILPVPFFNTGVKPGENMKLEGIGHIYSVAFHPEFAANGKFYVSYIEHSSIHGNKCKLVISEFTAGKTNNDIAEMKTMKRVFEMEGKNIEFNGAGIKFGPDAFLYISIGDDQLGDSQYVHHAQDLDHLNGKLLRIDVNKLPYTIPADNPFVAVKNARPEIWAYGLRKLWRFSFDSSGKQLLGGDVGENKLEEVDMITKGANYGWPAREGDSSYGKNNADNISAYTAPINCYNRKSGNCIIGGNFYYGTSIAQLNNKYVFGDFSGHLFALMKNAEGTWIRQPLKILNKPKDPFLICGCNTGENNELFVTGILNASNGLKGALYKIVKP